MKNYLLLLLLCIYCLGMKSQRMQYYPWWKSQSAKAAGTTQLCENIGGSEEFKRFLFYHMIYPPELMIKKIEGTVVIQYHCDKEGMITSFKLVDRVAPAIDSEAVRLFNLMLWNPSVVTKETVSTTVDCDNTISFPFYVSKYGKWNKKRDKANPNLDKLPLDTSGTIYSKVDKQANYVRGERAFIEYMKEELSYPDEAKAKGIQGTVIVGFVIETDGFVSNMIIKQSLGGGCDTEALRIMGPTKWKPAQKDGKLVRSFVSYPVTFKLNTDFHDNSMGGQNQGGNGGN
jgi:periplasmic protein TonB